MKNIEKFIGALIIALVLLRLFIYVSFLDTIIVLLTLVLSIIYLALSFALLNNVRLRSVFKKVSYNNVSILKIIGAIGTGIVLSLICIYSLFKFMRWPFADQGLSISLITLLIPIVVTAIKWLTTKNEFYITFLIRLVVIGVIGTIFYFTTTEQILEIKNKNFPEYVEAEKKLMRDPQNKELQRKVFEERQKKNSLD